MSNEWNGKERRACGMEVCMFHEDMNKKVNENRL